MLDFEREGLNVRYNCVSSVHDSIIFDVPGTLIDEALPKIKEIMERPGSMLVDPVVAPNGLHCEVELSISDRSWADLQEVKV
jgi:DNA polymerase I-like protein with 3'-5' exonuclease and polymerase domains